MAHARLTHPTRETVPFHQGQTDEYSRQAVASVVRNIGDNTQPLVNTETREANRSATGSVTARRRAANDPDTSDGRQALANYVDRLEAAVDEFQGDPGYTLVDDQLGYARTGILESVSWSLTPGRPDELDYEAAFVEGQGVFEERTVTRENPTYDTGMDVYATVDGETLPGMRQYQLERAITLKPKAIFDRDSAENNDIVVEEGPQRRITFQGLISGPTADRETKDQALEATVATKTKIQFDTKFPGYTVEGFVTAYQSTLEQQRGGNAHRYRLEFTEGERA